MTEQKHKLNPFRANMVSVPENFQWSSYNQYIANQKAQKWLVRDFKQALINQGEQFYLTGKNGRSIYCPGNTFLSKTKIRAQIPWYTE